MTDTFGGTVTVSYKSSAKYVNTRLPFNYWVVNSLVTNNGMTGPHDLTSITGYSYAQGLYDFPSKEFRGFGQVTETRGDATIVNHYYLQDEAKKGKEYRTEINDAVNTPYASTVNTWDCQQLYPVSPACATTGDLSKIVYVSNLTQSDNYTYDGVVAAPKIATKQYQYDAYGNVGLLIDLGDAGLSGDEVYAYSEFWTGCPSGINNRVNHSYVTAAPNGAKLREKFLTYDGASACPTKGNLTKEESWLNTGANPIAYYEYDSYGNRTKVTDPNTMVTQTTYDSTYNTFPVSLINAKNQTTTRTYDAVSGQVLSETDPNGFITSNVYDTFKRKIREVRPYDSDSSPTTSIQYVLNGTAPSGVITHRKDGTPTYDTVQSIDGFGNLIQTKSEDQSGLNKVAVDIYYDSMGRTSTLFNPYLTDSALAYSTPNTSMPVRTYTYDVLGRLTVIINPDQTQVSRTFDHWFVTETDENGHSKSYQFDASQRLKQVVEKNQGNFYTTNYQYNPFGELTRTTDHLGNITTVVYDSLGRKTQLLDPDMGIWSYGYDKVGNLTSQTDGRGITTTMQYDQLNRKTDVFYPTNPSVHLLYDAARIGTLSQVTDAGGVVGYQYDMRLRKTREIRIMDGTTWTTLWSYDSMDRVTTQTYPDGQTVTFGYTPQGKLGSVGGVIPTLSYNAAGQLLTKAYANGKTTNLSYDSRSQRLQSILTAGLQTMSYTYDNVGNVQSITNGATQNFVYDDLDRLTHASDSGYDAQYQYDAIGNIKSQIKDGLTTTYAYGTSANGPHAVQGLTSPLPVVGSLIINNGDAFTNVFHVTLNNVSMGSPSQYMASENSLFTGATWQTYSTAPSFALSAGYGLKTVYFKVKNADGESGVKSGGITLTANPYTLILNAAGSGSGNVSSSPGGVNFNYPQTNTGGASLNYGTSITVTASSTNSIVGWTGPCVASAGSQMSATCTISSLTGVTTLTANFNSCNFALTPSYANVKPAGEIKSVNITANNDACAWTSVSNVPWITIDEGVSGAGSKTIWYVVASNPGAVRTGTMTLAGQTFTVTQGTTSTHAQIGVFRAGAWFIDRDETFGWSGCGADGCYSYGMAGDQAVAGDWDGTGIVRMGAFRNGSWYLDYNGDGQWSGCGTTADTDRCYTFGMAGDIPVIGDWNGNGISKMGVFRNGNWYLDYNGDGQWSGCGTTTDTDRCYTFGMAGDIPVVGDWNGNGVSKIGVFRNGNWYLDYNGDGQWSGCGATPSTDRCYTYGMAGDTPVIGDWNGDVRSKIGVFRNGMWYLNYVGTNNWIGCGAPVDSSKDACVPFGMSGDLPVVFR